MAFLAGGFIPSPYTISTAGDAWLAVVAIVLFAVAVTAALVFAGAPAKPKPVIRERPRTTLPTAA